MSQTRGKSWEIYGKPLFWDTLCRSFYSFDIPDLFRGDLLTLFLEIVIGEGHKTATFSRFLVISGHF